MLCVGTGTLIDSWSQRTGCAEASVLNRSDRPSPMAGEAEVKFLDGDFRIVRPGAFVRCAVTGVPIPLEELKYWSVESQEAYASPEAGQGPREPPQGQKEPQSRKRWLP